MSRRFRIIYIVILFSLFLVYAITSSIQDFKEADQEKKFLTDQNIYLAGIVKKTIPESDSYRGYTVIYLQDFKTNKNRDYKCIYKDKYLYCMIKDNEALIVGDVEMKPGDSVVFNTAVLKYKLYKGGKFYVEDGTAIDDEDQFYDRLDLKGYLTFDYYHKK